MSESSDKYYPGKGCKCHAWSAIECCCDGVDWRSSREVELEAIVDKLPKYADTGQPFVPGVDECWCVVKCLKAWKIAIREAVPADEGWGVGACEYDEDCIEAFYSNAAAAALAAKDKL